MLVFGGDQQHRVYHCNNLGLILLSDVGFKGSADFSWVILRNLISLYIETASMILI